MNRLFSTVDNMIYALNLKKPSKSLVFEVLVNAEIRSQRVTGFELRDVQSSMSVDARGFLGLFEGVIGSNIRSRASSVVEQAWSRFSPSIIAAIEGLFARIERWTAVDSGETHWRSRSKDGGDH